ncbi:DNA recombination protein RmuC [Neomegalonema sp.]|uniref:DNA recombination protein RmuC n=1 Tax=Neomegalonema sp. TaxID=2039713 RepID=UPI002620AB4C|nr:DNA recombination protein RmuC [Neomegalonema sp.]MDD2869811.1 DNA recombination protein RmuC [Neomegalonema sp.]
MARMLEAMRETEGAILWMAGGAAALVLLLAILAFAALRAARRAARATEPLTAEIGRLGEALGRLNAAQERMTGGLGQIGQAQSQTQAATLETLERRLDEVSTRLGDSLSGSAQRTAQALGDLRQRLEVIDRAQGKIERLSGDILGLQNILSNKQARGAMGEIQLQEIVAQALPAGSYRFQAQLSNGRRVDCLLETPPPTGLLPVDSKFPLEAWRRLAEAESPAAKTEAAKAFRADVGRHLRDVADRYVAAEETADSALMFLPSEAIYAEIHANFPDLVRLSFEKKVWIVSPSTFMATLHTLRAVLRDARLQERSAALRRQIGTLQLDAERLGVRIKALETHFGQAEGDLREVGISATKILRAARRLEEAEFDAEPPAGAAPRERAADLPEIAGIRE